MPRLIPRLLVVALLMGLLPTPMSPVRAAPPTGYCLSYLHHGPGDVGALDWWIADPAHKTLMRDMSPETTGVRSSNFIADDTFVSPDHQHVARVDGHWAISLGSKDPERRWEWSDHRYALVVSDPDGLHEIVLQSTTERWTAESFAGVVVWSPNSQWIAFSWQADNGQSVITVSAWDGSSRTDLAVGSNSVLHGFSPDGLYLAFSDDSGSIPVVSFWSVQTHKLTARRFPVSLQDMAWQASGHQLAALNYASVPVPAWTLGWISPDGDPVVVHLTTQPSNFKTGELRNLLVDWSADAGSALVSYQQGIVDGYEDRRYAILRPDGTITALPPVVPHTEPVWSADGHSLFFVQGTRANFGITVFHPDTGQFAGIASNAVAYSFSRDRQFLAFEQIWSDQSLSLELLDTHTFRRTRVVSNARMIRGWGGTPYYGVSSTGFDDVSWSPDNRTVATLWREGTSDFYRLTLARIDGFVTTHTIQALNSIDNHSLRWLANGTQFGYLTRVPDTALTLIDVQTGGVRKRTYLTGFLQFIGEYPQRHDFVIWWLNDQNAGIDFYDADGTLARRYSDIGPADAVIFGGYVVWGPDGLGVFADYRMYFATSQSDLYVFEEDGTLVTSYNIRYTFGDLTWEDCPPADEGYF